MRLAALLAGLALGLPTLAGAQSKAPPPSRQAAPPATPPAADALARALLPQAEWNALLDRIAGELTDQVSRALTSKQEPIPDDLSRTLRKELDGAIQYDETLRGQAQALAKRFTPDEMNAAAQFYESAVGKKVLARLPEAQTEVGQSLQSRLSSAVPSIVKRVAPRALSPSRPGPEQQGSGSGAEPPPGGAKPR